jgi:hypothetical protein
LLLKN